MTSPFTPSPDDTSINLLRQIFGSAIDHIAGGGNVPAPGMTAVTAALQFFNSGVLFFGAFLLSWITVFGVAHTANDGAALGKKWNTFWTPIRTTVSMGLLIPTAAGISGVQVLVLTVVVWSCGFASQTWQGTVDHLIGVTAINSVESSLIDDKSWDSVAMGALRMQVCARGLHDALQSVTPNPIPDLRLDVRMTSTPLGEGRTEYQTTFGYVGILNDGTEASTCGTLTVKNTVATETGKRLQVDLVSGLNEALAQARMRRVYELFSGPVADVAGIVSDVAGNPEDRRKIDGDAVYKVISMSRELLMQDMKSALHWNFSSSGPAQRLTERGWVWAGSLYFELARLKTAIREASSLQTTYRAGNERVDTSMGSGAVGQAANAVLARYANTAATLRAHVDSLSASSGTASGVATMRLDSNLNTNDFGDGGMGVKARIESFFNSVGNWLLAGIVHQIADDESENRDNNKAKRRDDDPILKVKDIGDYLVGAAEAYAVGEIFAASVLRGARTTCQVGSQESVLGTNLAAGGAIICGAIAGVEAFVEKTSSEIGFAMKGIAGVGYFMGYFLPAMPFLVFAIGVVGWLVSVVEAVVAAPLWAVMHITPESRDSFIGGQQQGYLLLLSLFFRPALMIIGLVIALVALRPTMVWVNEAFLLMVRTTQAGSIFGVFSVLAWTLIYAFLVGAIFFLFFGLPQTLPDKALRWVSAGTGDIGESAGLQRVESGASGQAKAAFVGGMSATQGSSREAAAERRAGAAEAAQQARDGVQQRIASALEGMSANEQLEGQSGQSMITAGGPLATRESGVSQPRQASQSPEKSDGRSSSGSADIEGVSGQGITEASAQQTPESPARGEE